MCNKFKLTAAEWKPMAYIMTMMITIGENETVGAWTMGAFGTGEPWPEMEATNCPIKAIRLIEACLGIESSIKQEPTDGNE